MTSTNSSGQWNTWHNRLYSDAEYSDQSQVLMYRLESPWQIIQMQLMTTIHRSRSLPVCHSQFITIFIAFDFTWSYLNTFTQLKNAFAQNWTRPNKFYLLKHNGKNHFSSQNVGSLGGRKENVVENLLLTVFRVGTMSCFDGSQFIHNRHNYSESNFHQHFFSIFRMNITVFVFNCSSIAR